LPRREQERREHGERNSRATGQQRQGQSRMCECWQRAKMSGGAAGYCGKATKNPRRNLSGSGPMSSLRPVPVGGYNTGSGRGHGARWPCSARRVRAGARTRPGLGLPRVSQVTVAPHSVQ
jgi:hypothetical protein